MQDEPADLGSEQVAAALSTYWGIDGAEVVYAPLGHGSYHWTARERDGTRWFVTADARIGNAFDRVLAAYQAAAMLRTQGLEFIHTPTSDLTGQLWRRISPGWALSINAWLKGRRPDYMTAERTAVAELIGRLHTFSPVPAGTPYWERPIHARPVQELLDTLDRPWAGGPYSEPTRTLLARSTSGIVALLEHFEQLADRLTASDEPWVITHGEPHAGDILLDTSGAMHVIDWDDTRVAPRERDLRILLHGGHEKSLGWDNGDFVAAYQRIVGPVHPRSFALDVFRADWALGAIRESQLFRHPHRETADTAARWQNLNCHLPVDQNWPHLA